MFFDTATWVNTENYMVFIHILGSSTYSHYKKPKKPPKKPQPPAPKKRNIKKKIHRVFACTFGLFPHISHLYHYTAL